MAKKGKKKSEFVREIELATPIDMEYSVNIENDKERHKFINRVEKIVRSSTEYRDYIQFLKEHIGLDRCIFFQQVSGKEKGKHITIEMHHEPLTLYDIVNIVLEKYIQEGLEINDLLIADEVLELHYANQVGLVPLSKTIHEIIHNSEKLMVPLNMCYGEYTRFLEAYDPYIDDSIYDKLERKADMTKKLTPESFDAIKKEFTYLDIDGVEDTERMELNNEVKIA